jgi:hypothetical protein
VVSRHTLPNLRTPQLVSLNRLSFRQLAKLHGPKLTRALLMEKHLSVAAADTVAANIVRPKRDAPPAEEVTPTLRWLRVV